MSLAGDARYGDSATVGAGLPLLRSLRELREGGDRIHAIAGVLSGSLAWLFNQYDGMRPFSAQNCISPTRSSMWIHGIHWFPVPRGDPIPSLNGRSIFASAPPPFPRTTPMRTETVRTPPCSSARRASFSQAAQVSARKPWPRAESSVSISSPRSP